MTRDQIAVIVNEQGIGPAPRLQALLEFTDLRAGVCARVIGERFDLVDWNPFNGKSAELREV